MGDQQQRSRIFRQPVLEPQHGIEVQMVGRLVEQQQVGAAHQRLRKIEAHAPAAGKTRHGIRVPRFRKAQPREQRGGTRPRAVTADFVEAMVQVGQGLAIERMIALRGGQRGFDFAQLAVAVEHVVDGGHRHRGRFLCDVGDRPRRGQVDRSRVGKELEADGGEETRLAAAIGPDEPDLVAGVDGQVGAFEQALGAPGQCQIRDAQHGLGNL
jgi:hypothetical protein